MIVVDASAAVALVLAEPVQGALAEKLASSEERAMSPISYSELVMVLSRAHSHPKLIADAFVRDMRVMLLTIDRQQTELAVHAFLLYGKGRHPARLSLGDCFSYAAAKALDSPLLFVGGDFSQTDVLVA
ncbi:MAG TPA: type II toxin-antitoxin system VapC family toxin [Rhizomicrobium sp.]|jgi:ribonuclease VapC|nr:type II toxin-antitoxin system VapC family toxin [Rhizomicrobium sp.]